MKKSLSKIILSFLLIFSLHFSLFAQQLTVDVLVVSGGGSGGAGYGGGGGGGAVKYFTSQTVSGATTITVGAGGAAVNITTNGTAVTGNPGESSSFGSLIATSSSSANGPNHYGGGGGGAGSGGGAGGTMNTAALLGGTAVSGMGNDGGNSAGNGRNYSTVCGGGGGGAGAVGGLGGTNTSPANRGGAGGAGISNSISGVAIFYGGGGGGGVTFNGNAGGAGGNGGGGAGSKGDAAATNGTANTGGGGGGFGASNGGASNNYSGAGGSGVVIVRYLGNTILATGGVITQAGGYTIHTFNTSGTFALPCNANTGDTTASACGSFVWYGVTYTSSATPTRKFTNVGGCDSVVTLHLTINNANTGDTTATACGSFVWYGETFTASATPTHTFTNVGGCDSVVTLQLTIKTIPSTPSVNVVNNCNGTSTLSTTASGTLLWNTTETSSSITVSNVGTYTVTQTANGCVSAAGSGVAAPKTNNTGDTTASACGSFVWYGVTYSTSGTPTHTFKNMNGCDSVVTLHLTINSFPTAPTGTDAARCGTGTVGLLASGTGTIKWYNASTGGTLLDSGNSYTTPSISSTTIYYAMDSIVATGCVSATRTAVTATVNQLPAVPDVTNASRCGAGTVTLSATSAAGTVIDWSSDVRYIRYSCTNSSDGGQANLQELQAYKNGVNIALNKPGNSNSDYFSNSYLSVNDGNINSRWSSNRNNPGPASVLNPHYVEIDLGDNYIVDSITLFGDQYFNYNYILSVSGDANSWSSIGQGNLNSTPITYRMITTPLLTASNTFTTPSISATTSYYVVARDMVTGCVSATRTAVTATVIPLPAKPVVTNGSGCIGSAVTLNATSTSGTVVDWYETLSSTTPLLSASNTFTTPSISSPTSYYVEARDVTTGCLSSQGSVNNNIALNLDGNNDIVNLPMPALNSFTIEYWVKSTQASPSGSQWYNGNGIVDAEVGGGTTDFGTALLNDKLAFGVGDPDVTIFSTTSINTGSWNHVAATWNGSTGLMKLYINGTLEASANGATGLRSAPSAIRIGNLLPNIQNFNGTLDELRIWNVVRTQSEIQENINNELNQQSGLVEAYHFNQGVAGGSNSGITTIADASGNNRNGSMLNFSLSGTSSNFVEGSLLNNSRTVVTANINTRTTSTDTVAACVSYTWNGVTYTTSGTKTWRGTNAAGCDSVATLILKISTSTYSPFGVTQTVISNVCSSRVYRYTASVAPVGTTYNWILPNSIGGVNGVTVDSGDINSSRTLLVRYTSNEAAFATDSIKVRSFNGCTSKYTAVKLTNIKLSAPTVPASITVTSIGASNCLNRTYRFTAPALPAGTNSSNSTILPATGYLWSLVGNLSEYATIDSGNENSQKIVVSFSSNAAAVTGDSIKLQYLSSCGNSIPRALKLSNTKLNGPLAPATITITALQTNVCGARKYRYTAPNLPVATTNYGAATGYAWSLVGALSNTATIDSGNVNSQKIVVTFTSNAAAATGDSIRLYYTSDCGNGARKASKLTNTLLGAPSAPATITIQAKSDVCNARTYRYIAPAVLPVATTTIGAASGYLWSAPTGNVGSTGTIDSGEVNSRIITVTYSSNAAAGVGDSIRLVYTSLCGDGKTKAQKLSNLVKNGCTPIAKNVSTSRVPNTVPTSMEVNVYPNPTTSQFNIQVKSAGTEEVVVRVLDLTGRFIKSIKVSSNSNLSLGSDLKAGAYMLEVKQGKEVKMVRVVKF